MEAEGPAGRQLLVPQGLNTSVASARLRVTVAYCHRTDTGGQCFAKSPVASAVGFAGNAAAAMVTRPEHGHSCVP